VATAELPEVPSRQREPRVATRMEKAGPSILIIGGGGHGKVVADLVRASGGEVAGYCDADSGKLGVVVEPGGARVICSQEDLLERIARGEPLPPGVDAVALGVGNNRQRWEIYRRLAAQRLPVLAHPSVVISPSARIGSGTVLVPGSVVNANSQVGAAVIVNTAATVGHDCQVADGVHVAPGANVCGGVSIGECTWVGAGSVIVPGVRVGRDVMIGAGAVVLRDVADGTTVVGNPARIIRGRGAEAPPKGVGTGP